MKKTTKAYLIYKLQTQNFDVWNFKPLGSEYITLDCKDVEFDIPDDFDPRPAQIAALQAKQKEAAAAFQAFTTETMRQIQELQALEMTK